MAASFEPPTCKLIFEAFSLKKGSSHIQKRIERKFFNHAVSLCIPDHAQVPQVISSVLDNEPYWIVKNLPLCKLIESEFIECFVKRGKMHMLSHGTNIDEENCFALTPNGELILNITKDTFEELGLEGHLSEFSKKRPRKYVIKINMTTPYFKPGKKNYERVKWCLTDRLGLSADFICLWKPHDNSVCPSSLSNYFIKQGYKCPLYSLHHKLAQCLSKSRPIVNSDNVEETDENCSFTQFWEWLGGIAIGADEGSPDDYVNTMACPSPSTAMGTCVTSTYTGIISPSHVSEILDKCRSFVQEAGIPWITLTVHGFSDSPVSWEGWEHGYNVNGDNLYAIVLFPNDDYWLYMASGAHDTFT